MAERRRRPRRKPPSVEDRLERIECQLTQVLRIGDHLMAANAEFRTFLQELRVYTDDIAKDVDELLLRDGTLTPETKAEMEALRDTLKAIGAKVDNPLPPPVEPPV